MREDDTIVMLQKTVAMIIGKRLIYRQLVDGKDELGNKIDLSEDNKDEKDEDKAA